MTEGETKTIQRIVKNGRKELVLKALNTEEPNEIMEDGGGSGEDHSGSVQQEERAEAADDENILKISYSCNLEEQILSLTQRCQSMEQTINKQRQEISRLKVDNSNLKQRLSIKMNMTAAHEKVLKGSSRSFK